MGLLTSRESFFNRIRAIRSYEKLAREAIRLREAEPVVLTDFLHFVHRIQSKKIVNVFFGIRMSIESPSWRNFLPRTYNEDFFDVNPYTARFKRISNFLLGNTQLEATRTQVLQWEHARLISQDLANASTRSHLRVTNDGVLA